MGRRSGISHTCGERAAGGERRGCVRGAYGLAADLVRERLRGERVLGVDLLDEPEADLGVAASVVGGLHGHGTQQGRERSGVFYF